MTLKSNLKKASFLCHLNTERCISFPALKKICKQKALLQNAVAIQHIGSPYQKAKAIEKVWLEFVDAISEIEKEEK